MEELRSIVTHLNKLGAICYLVGGAVRDQVLGLEPKDLDVEVYGLKSELVVAALEEFGSVDLVGSSFGIIKLKTLFNEYDFPCLVVKVNQAKVTKDLSLKRIRQCLLLKLLLDEISRSIR